MNSTFHLRYTQYGAISFGALDNFRRAFARLGEHNYINKYIVSFVILNFLALFDYGLLSTRVFFTGDVASTAIAVLLRKVISYNALWAGACVIYWNISRVDFRSKSNHGKALFHVIHCVILTLLHQVVIAWSISTELLDNPYYHGTMLKALVMGVTGLFHINLLFYIGIISLGHYMDNQQDTDSTERKKSDSLMIKDPSRILFLKKDKIRFIKSEQNYVAIYTHDQSLPILTRKTMQEIQNSIDSSFVKVHRSYIVKKDEIVEIVRSKNGMDYSIKLSDDTIIPVSRSNKSKLFEQTVL